MDISMLQRKIKKEGPDAVTLEFASKDFPETLKRELTQLQVFIDGYVNISLIYSLA